MSGDLDVREIVEDALFEMITFNDELDLIALRRSGWDNERAVDYCWDKLADLKRIICDAIGRDLDDVAEDFSIRDVNENFDRDAFTNRLLS